VTGPIDIARVVCGGDEPPDWLVSALETACNSLSWQVHAEARYPSRNALLKRLRALEAAAELVRASLRDIDMTMILLNGDWQFLNQNEMHHGLGDVARRAKRIIDAIPKRQGRDKFFVRSEGLTLHVNCALTVSIIWERAHGCWPPVNNDTAQQTCDMLWAAAGGPEFGGWGGSDSGWRNHLRAAKAAGQSMEAKHIRRLLALG
jgi:hypothetical protein